MDRGSDTLGVHDLVGGEKDGIYGQGLEGLAVGLPSAGIGLKIGGSGELGGVDVNGDDDDITVGLGQPHQGEVPLVEAPHGGHQTDGPPGRSPEGAQVLHGMQHPHLE